MVYAENVGGIFSSFLALTTTPFDGLSKEIKIIVTEKQIIPDILLPQTTSRLVIGRRPIRKLG